MSLTDKERDELLTRTTEIIRIGMARARRMANAVSRGDKAAAGDAGAALVKHCLDLDRDTLERLAVNALTTAAQLEAQLTAERAFNGGRRKARS